MEPSGPGQKTIIIIIVIRMCAHSGCVPALNNNLVIMPTLAVLIIVHQSGKFRVLVQLTPLFLRQLPAEPTRLQQLLPPSVHTAVVLQVPTAPCVSPMPGIESPSMHNAYGYSPCAVGTYTKK
jgi:hypothetical protein